MCYTLCMLYLYPSLDTRRDHDYEYVCGETIPMALRTILIALAFSICEDILS